MQDIKIDTYYEVRVFSNPYGWEHYSEHDDLGNASLTLNELVDSGQWDGVKIIKVTDEQGSLTISQVSLHYC